MSKVVEEIEIIKPKFSKSTATMANNQFASVAINKYKMTFRQCDVAWIMFYSGEKNEFLAKELHMTVNTLKTHLKAINKKLGVGSRPQAVAKLWNELNPPLPIGAMPYEKGIK